MKDRRRRQEIVEHIHIHIVPSHLIVKLPDVKHYMTIIMWYLYILGRVMLDTYVIVLRLQGQDMVYICRLISRPNNQRYF